MKQKILITLLLALLMAAPHGSFAQYFQALYDVDTSQDWGVDIALQPDGNYFVRGVFGRANGNNQMMVNMQVDLGTNAILSKHIIDFEDIHAYHGVDISGGGAGQLVRLARGGYISPVNEYIDYRDSIGTVVQREWAGLIKYNAAGDTVFIKTYTDTSLYYGGMTACALMPDGGYIVGGQQGLNNSLAPPAMIVRTDSMGDTLWTRTYQEDTLHNAQIESIIPLADGRIAVGAYTYHWVNPGPNYYGKAEPWFMILDSMGNVIRQVIYATGHEAGGLLYPDKNGGYTTMGSVESIYNSDPNDVRSFPLYIAHLDSNFAFTWSTTLPYDTVNNSRGGQLINQLRDSSYIIVGWQSVYGPPTSRGWAAKINRSGDVVWNQYYQSDETHRSQFSDMVEKPDGSLLFVGSSYNDTLPAFHTTADIWLVGADSNGCDNRWCAPAKVGNVLPAAMEVKVFPNPATGAFTITTMNPGRLEMYDMQGRRVASYQVTTGETQVQRSGSLSNGIYLCRYMPDNAGNAPVVLKLVIE